MAVINGSAVFTLSIIAQDKSYLNTSSLHVGMLLISFFVCFFFSSSFMIRPMAESAGSKGGKLMSIWISGGICLGNFEIGTASSSGSSSTPKARSTARLRPASVGFGPSLSLLRATKSKDSLPGVKFCNCWGEGLVSEGSGVGYSWVRGLFRVTRTEGGREDWCLDSSLCCSVFI